MQFLYYLSQLACIVPAVLLFTFTFFRLKARDRAGEYLLVVLAGAISTVPAIMLSKSWALIAETQSEKWAGLSDFYFIFFQAFFVVALTEEFCKYLSIQLTVGGTDSVTTLREGMVFGAGASLGFALVENILYGAAAQNPSDVIMIGLSRGITAVPFHGLAGSIIGYAIARSKIETKLSRNAQIQIRMEGLLLAIVFHGLYDFFLFMGGYWSYGIIPVLIIMIVLFFINLNHAKLDYGKKLD
jgi:RsiW-degrading membrane proteinase PrsW (M82 family)